MALRTKVTIALLAFMSVAAAEEHASEYRGSMRIAYQYIHTGDFEATYGPEDLGETDTHVLLLSGDYWLNDRWRVFASLPYVQKRHEGNYPHDFTEFPTYTPSDPRIIDDGDYHGGLQDFHVGIQYLAVDGRVSVSPYVSYGVPVRDYPFYGSAAIGKQLWEVPVGVSLEFSPYFSDWHFQADIAYVFSEKVLGVDLDYWLTYVSASYYVTPRFVPRIFLTGRNVPNGLVYPDDFTDDFSPDDYDNEWFYHHDQTLKHAYLNAGIGFDFVVSERHEISATYYRTVDPDNISKVDNAFTVGVSRRF